MTLRRSSRSARTPVNGPNRNPAIERSPRAKPTAATPGVSEWMYTARAMNVTNDPASEIHSEIQMARTSRSRRTAKISAVRCTVRGGMPSIIDGGGAGAGDVHGDRSWESVGQRFDELGGRHARRMDPPDQPGAEQGQPPAQGARSAAAAEVAQLPDLDRDSGDGAA